MIVATEVRTSLQRLDIKKAIVKLPSFTLRPKTFDSRFRLIMLSFKSIYVQIVLWVCINANAIPTQTLASVNERAVNCNAVSGALKVLQSLGAPATSFCSSYLRVPATATTTVTSTPIRYTEPDLLSCTIADLARSTVTTIVGTTTVYSRTCQAPARRAAPIFGEGVGHVAYSEVLEVRQAVNIAALQVFAASQLSSGCSCLNLAPKTTRIVSQTAAPSVSGSHSLVYIFTLCIKLLIVLSRNYKYPVHRQSVRHALRMAALAIRRSMALIVALMVTAILASSI